jgi:type VI secretion system secreted protein Hcp
MPWFMNYDGIEGDVTEQNHTNWVMCNSLQFGVGRGIAAPEPGNLKDREGADASVSEFVLTKDSDFASTACFRESLKGTGKTCVIEFCEGTEMRVLLKLTLSESLISGYSMSSGGDKPTESISVNCSKIEWEYTPSSVAHEQDGPQRASYDIATHVLA